MYYTISYNLFPITITCTGYRYTQNSTDYFKYHFIYSIYLFYLFYILSLF